MLLLLMVLIVTAVLIVAWASGVLLKYARQRRAQPHRRPRR